ncbi:MAG: ROK family protein [Bacteroidota bacterium]
MNGQQLAIGIDLGATHIKGILINKKGDILSRKTMPTEDGKEEEGWNWKRRIKEMIQAFLSESEEEVLHIGLAAPGIANETFTAIAWMPGRVLGIESFDWSDWIGRKVEVINDAHAALIAEHCYGEAQGKKDVLLLTLGTGVGGGVLVRGELLRGFMQRGGHLGHISLNAEGELPGITRIPGSLEDAIGNSTVERRSFGRFASTDLLVAAHQQGDPFASYVWLNSVRKLALGICSYLNAISPELVLLGGGITHAGPDLFDPLTAFMEVFEWRPGGIKVEIKAAKFSSWTGAIGAAAFSLRRSEYVE